MSKKKKNKNVAVESAEAVVVAVEESAEAVEEPAPAPETVTEADLDESPEEGEQDVGTGFHAPLARETTPEPVPVVPEPYPETVPDPTYVWALNMNTGQHKPGDKFDGNATELAVAWEKGWIKSE